MTEIVNDNAPPMNTNPYVSFVTWGRNDGYTPDYLRRVDRATNCLAGQLDRAGVDAEIIIVEWNPVPGRPLLLETLRLPRTLKHVTIRGFIVGQEYHLRHPGSQERGIHVAEASNVGIRRARGRFISAKASDTFFSSDVITRLAKGGLDTDTMYRVDRHDFRVDDPSIWDLDDDELLAKIASLPSAPQEGIEQTAHWRLRELHTNACGDFTLLDASYWHLLRGHPRDETVLSFDIDSLVMHAAAGYGVNECRWPPSCKVFKPIHGRLNNSRIVPVWEPWQRKLDRLLANKVNPETAHRARMLFDYPRRKMLGVESVIGHSIERNFVQPASRWARGELPLPTQTEDWGLAGEALEERILCSAAWLNADSAVNP